MQTAIRFPILFPAGSSATKVGCSALAHISALFLCGQLDAGKMTIQEVETATYFEAVVANGESISFMGES